MTKIIVTEPEYVKASAIFEAGTAQGLACVPVAHEDAACAEAIREHGAQHAIVGAAPYRKHVYEALPTGGVLARFGVGCDGIDLGRATQRGLLCTNTPGVLDASVAEFTMGLVSAAARGLPALCVAAKAGEWPPGVGMELRGKRLAIIG